MNKMEFNKITKETFKACEKILEEKSKFYGQNEDRLAQLKMVAVAAGTTPYTATHTLVSKHFVALGEMLRKVGNFDDVDFDAYLLDIINYMILLRALLNDRP